MATTKKDLYDAQYKRASKDIVYFCEEFLRVKKPIELGAQGYMDWELYPYQKDILPVLAEGGSHVILKSRQIGFSTLSAALLLWEIIFLPEIENVICSHKRDHARKLLGEATKMLNDFMLDNVGFCEHNGIEIVAAKREEITLGNGSTLYATSSNEPARGGVAHTVVLDEAAYLHGELGYDVFDAILPGSERRIILSTAKGKNNMFHEKYYLAKRINNDSWRAHFFGWNSVPYRDDVWYAEKHAALGETKMAQEFPAEPNEAFMLSSNNVFNLDALALMPVASKDEYTIGEIYCDMPDTFNHRQPQMIHYRENKGGKLRMYELPNPEHKYVIGVDTGEGHDASGDKSIMQVVNAHTAEQVAVYEDIEYGDELAKTAYLLGVFYNTARIIPENQGIGWAFTRALVALNYPKIYRMNRKGKKDKWGYSMNGVSKTVLISDFQSVMETQGILVRDETTLDELRNYLYLDKGGYGGAPFDDHVIALALAYEGIRTMVITSRESGDSEIDGFVAGDVVKKDIPERFTLGSATRQRARRHRRSRSRR